MFCLSPSAVPLVYTLDGAGKFVGHGLASLHVPVHGDTLDHSMVMVVLP